MKQKICLIILAAFLVVTAWAVNVKVDGINYALSSDYTACVTGGTYSGDIVIPETFVYGGDTYKVTEIGMSAFSNCKGLKSISLPGSIIIISNHAFYGCSGLTSINLPKSLLFIYQNAFDGCPLERVYSFSEVPPFLNIDTAIHQSVLYVPKGCVEAYIHAWNFPVGQVFEIGTVHTNTTTDGYTQVDCDLALNALTVYLRSTITAQYCMLGGKEGDAPGSHAYQYQYICTDGYAQYAVIPHCFFAYTNDHNYNSTYYINTSFNPGPMSRFVNSRNALAPALTAPRIKMFPELKSIFTLLYDYVAVECAECYGALPYSDYKKADIKTGELRYESLADIYDSVVSDIDNITACLQKYPKQPKWYKEKVQKMLYRYGKIVQDVYTGREGFDTWIRFANSLKLRMAMRIVKVKPELARQWAEEAVAGGVVESNEQQIGLQPMNEGFSHPLLDITKTWNDSRLGASFESILMSLEHPYTRYMFNKNSEELRNSKTGDVTPAGTRIVGLRAGGHFGEDQQYSDNQYVGVSQVNAEGIRMAPIWMIKWAEVDFLRAEGALRGWDMGGDAQFFYERGIRNASLIDWTLFDYDYANLVDAYMQKEEATDYTYVDPFGDSPHMPSVTKIGVKWNEGDDRETKLEKIITQKYIALYPNSYEAWAELRRTGYPRLFPVLNPQDGDGSLKDGDMIRRMPYPGRWDDATNKDIERSGLDALGGPDLQSTRVWWDVEGSNFPTGITSTVQTDKATAVFHIDGRRLTKPSRGVNIIRYSDGTTHKVLVK